MTTVAGVSESDNRRELRYDPAVLRAQNCELGMLKLWKRFAVVTGDTCRETTLAVGEPEERRGLDEVA
jgi:hypothetical protein